MIGLEPIFVLCFAFVLDIIAGDPPNRFHPVAWMGSAIAFFRRKANRSGNASRFVGGGLLILFGSLLTATIGWLIQRSVNELPVAISVLFQAMLLKSTFSARALGRAASSVAIALDSNDIRLARQQVAHHLVSRDVSSLQPSDLSAATIESVAENSSDSIVAPLFYFVIAGIPGALVYRFVNTCDAMIGYRTHELEWFGKPSARLDDLLNIIPSRLTAVLILLVGAFSGTACGIRQAFMVWRRDHGLTDSPNAGHPMSAAAGVLGVALEKPGHYRLGAELPLPSSQTIAGAIRLLWGTAASALCLFCLAIWLRGLA